MIGVVVRRGQPSRKIDCLSLFFDKHVRRIAQARSSVWDILCTATARVRSRGWR